MGNLKDGTYNGWTNYETWRVKLEMLDGLDLRDMGWQKLDKYDLSDALKVWCAEILEQEAREGMGSLIYSYAMAFLANVNWYEIAAMMLSEYADENETESEDA